MSKSLAECVDGICLLSPNATEGEEVEEAKEEKAIPSGASVENENKKNQQNKEEEQQQDEEEGDPKEQKQSASTNKKNTKKSGGGSSNRHIQKIHTQQDMDSLLASNDAVIVEFMTTWCGACKGIEPLLEELATENVDSLLVVAQVVCDKNKVTKKLATAHGIKSYPVFEVFENGNSIQKWNGADSGKLIKAFEKLGGGGGSSRVGGGKGGKKKGKRK